MSRSRKSRQPDFAFQKLVVRDRRLQRLVEERGEIGVARGDEGLEVGSHAVAARQYFVARQVAERRLRCIPCVPTP